MKEYEGMTQFRTLDLHGVYGVYGDVRRKSTHNLSVLYGYIVTFRDICLREQPTLILYVKNNNELSILELNSAHMAIPTQKSLFQTETTQKPDVRPDDNSLTFNIPSLLQISKTH